MSSVRVVLFSRTFEKAHPMLLGATAFLSAAFSPVVQGAALRYLFVSVSGSSEGGSGLPFFLLAAAQTPIFACAFFYLLFGLCRRDFGASSIGFRWFLLIGALSAAGHLLQAYALDSSYLTGSKFAMFALLDVVWAIPWGVILLGRHRSPPMRHWTVVVTPILLLIPVGLFWIVTWNVGDSATEDVDSHSDFLYLLLLLGARLLFALRNICARRAHLDQLEAMDVKLEEAKDGPEMDDLYVTKVRSVMASPAYDADCFGVSFASSYELELMGSGLFTGPAALIAALFHSETPSAWDDLFSYEWDAYAALGFLAVAQFAVPVLLLPCLVRGSASSYAVSRSFQMLFAVFASTLLSRTADPHSVAQSVAVAIAILVLFAVSSVAESSRKRAVFRRDLETLRLTFPDFSEEDARRVFALRRAFGFASASRAMAHIAGTRDPQAADHARPALTSLADIAARDGGSAFIGLHMRVPPMPGENVAPPLPTFDRAPAPAGPPDVETGPMAAPTAGEHTPRQESGGVAVPPLSVEVVPPTLPGRGAAARGSSRTLGAPAVVASRAEAPSARPRSPEEEIGETFVFDRREVAKM